MINALHGAKPEEAYPSVSYALGDSLNLRLLIHYVGDVHQPLHAVTRYTSSYPNGDAGGNLFPLTPNGEVKELHALWDSVLEEFSVDLTLPLNSTEWDFLTQHAQTLTTTYPESSFENLYTDYTTWAAEGLAIAESFVYKNIQENTLPSTDYITEGRQIAEKRIA